MKWTSKPDPKDEMIALLREQVAAKDLQILKLTEQVIALSNVSAHRALNPRAPLNTPSTPVPANPRAELYRPAVPLDKVSEFLDRKRV